MSYHSADELYALGQEIYRAIVRVVRKHAEQEANLTVPADQQAVSWEDQELERVGGLAPPGDTMVGALFGDIPFLLRDFGNSDPAKTQPTIDGLWQVAYTLNPDLSLRITDSGTGAMGPPVPLRETPDVTITDCTTNITTYLAHWEGRASNRFHMKFLDNVATAAPRYSMVAAVLAMTLQAHQQIRTNANADVWDIGQKTLKAIDGLYGWSNVSDTTVALSVFVASASVMSAIATGGVGAALAVGAFASSMISTYKQTAKIGGGSISSVIGDMRDAISRVVSGITDQEHGLAAVLDQISDNLAKLGQTSEIPAPTSVPGLLGGDRKAREDPDSPFGFAPT